jgi:hypothetical protein
MDRMKSERGRMILLIIVAGCCASGVFASDRAGMPDPRDGTAVASHVDFTSSNLPVMIINTRGQSIPNSRKIPADMGIIDNGRGNRNSVTDPWNGYAGAIAIEIRGSSAAGFPKLPYAFKTQDSSGADLNVSLLGMPKENDWVLYNPFSDKTFMRNLLAFKMSNDIGRYASRTRMIELVLNGDYEGIYVLMEKIKQDKNRVNISKMDSTDVEGDALTGGYIIKVDKTTGENVGGWSSQHKIFYQYHVPKPDRITPEQKAYIKGAVDAFETALDNPDGADPESGYRKVLSLDSFVDNVILSEVNRNVDAYRLSMYLYKNRDSKDGKFHAGPVWDCDLAFGNAYYHEAWKTEGWNLDALVASSEGSGVPYWWMKLRRDPTFLSRLRERWIEFRKDALNADSLVAFIGATADTLEEAQERNFRLYPILGTYVWPNQFIQQTFAEEVEFLKEWLQNRIAWLDGEFNGTSAAASEKTEPGIPVNCRLDPNYPNPFNSSTVIGIQLKSGDQVRVEVFDLRGRRVKILLDGFQQAGRRTLTWDGRDDSGRTVPSGVYTLRLDAGTETASRKLLFLQ